MSCLGLICIAMGSLFVWYLWASYKKASITNSWIETPATITQSSIDVSQLTQHYMTKYRLDVEYTYEFEGKKYTGTRIKRLPVESGDDLKVTKKMKAYPIGAEVTAFVNPSAPDEAVLERDSKAALYSIWFPCLFVLGGVGIIIANLSRRKAVVDE